MELIAKLKQIKGLNIAFELLEQINLERLKTLYGTLDNVEALIVFKDKRKLSDRQRAFYRALLNNIFKWCGEGTDELHEFFKEEYFLETGERISTKDNSKNSKSDMNKLLEIVIDFMFEFDVPFAKGYELLPKEDNWYLYQCCKHRKCAICGKKSDIHHVNAVGMGSNRKKVDNRWREFLSVCRKHHVEVETIGNEAFFEKYKVKGIKLDEDLIKKLRI
ncbi:putative HNHc nuclease [Vagococcus fluvialis]|uniref:putative HNHc nuclease n=1 Tax=Vagococcus fluvialis TaxID=2738 RepID=UPI003BF06B2F